MAFSRASYASWLLAVLSVASSTLAALDKPIISPEIPSMESELFNNLSPTQSTWENWESGTMPARCKAQAGYEGFDAADMEVFSITYTDCAEAWTMCRHKDSQVTQIEMIDVFGRLPVRMRNYARHVIAFPADARHAYTFGDLGDVVMFRDVGPYITLWVHEIAHSLDHNAVSGKPIFSSNEEWLAAYDEDVCISDSYAANNQVENFAQETVIALYDKIVPGGIGSIEPSWNDIFHQYATLQAALGDVLIPGGTGSKFFEDDYLVCTGEDGTCGLPENTKAMVTSSIEPTSCDYHA